MIYSSAVFVFISTLLLVTLRTRQVNGAEELHRRDRQGDRNDQEIATTATKQRPSRLDIGHGFSHDPISTQNLRPYQHVVPGQESLGTVGMETNSAFNKCRRLCQKHSGLRCRRVKKYWRTPATVCKTPMSLGYARSPSCCFYKHCFRLWRPSGRKRIWWRRRSVQLLLKRRGCSRNHA